MRSCIFDYAGTRLLVALAFALLATVPAAAADGTCPAPATDAPEDWEGQQQWLAIERAGLRVGKIKAEVTDVYESDEAWYAAGANWLHINTRDRVVRDLLLVEPDDPVTAREIYESARRMRNLGVFRQVSITPLACRDGVVDVLVQAKDAWSLIISAGASRAGGQNNTQIELEDGNFLGTGKFVQIESESDAVRSSTNYSYGDHALFGTRWRLDLLYKDQTDGRSNEVQLLRPFWTTSQTWGFILKSEDTVQTQNFYQYGEVAWHAQTGVRLTTASAWRLIAGDADSGWRAGLGMRSEERGYDQLTAVDPSLRPAPDLPGFKEEGVTLGLSRFEDHYASFYNLRSVDKTEDYNLGLNATLEFTPGQRIGLDAAWAARRGEDTLLKFELESQTRRDATGWRDGLISASFIAYAQSGRHTRLARLAYDWRDDPDPLHEAALGGDDGMLGYPQNYVVGDRILHLHLEDRWTTDRILFQTLRVGYAVVAEVGTGRRIGTKQWSETLADIGAGIRLGNLRGSFGQTFYITVFVPLVHEPGLDPYQIVLGDVITF